MVQALCDVFVGEAVDAFEFYDRHLLHQNVSVILPDVSALVRDWKPSLCLQPYLGPAYRCTRDY